MKEKYLYNLYVKEDTYYKVMIFYHLIEKKETDHKDIYLAQMYSLDSDLSEINILKASIPVYFDTSHIYDEDRRYFLLKENINESQVNKYIDEYISNMIFK